MADALFYRARYVDLIREELINVEFISEGEGTVTLRLIDGTDISVTRDAFDHSYIPVLDTTVDLSEMTS